ncbi:MAG: SAM-dependent methyltransferase [Gammaproteobacteria bacterium]
MAALPERPPWIAVGLISGTALAYEVLLTRLFALVHWHHLVATVISLALLGYGASGTFLALAQHRVRERFAVVFLSNAALFALGMLACFALAQAIPLDPQAVSWEPTQLLRLAAVYLVLALPFFGAANCIGLALWRHAARIPRLYSVDLLGAGVGALTVVVLLQLLHPAVVLPVLVVLGLLGTAAAAFELRRGRAAAVAFAVVVAGVLWQRGAVALHPAAYKDLARTLDVVGAQVETTTSGAMGVVTVVRNDRVPLRAAPGMSLLASELPPEQRAVFVDGDARGALDRSSPGAPPGYLRDLVSAFPYAVLRAPRVLVVGAGAGGRVLQALAHGAREVVAVEGSPQLVELPCRHYRTFTAACSTPRAHWRVTEVRAFLAGLPQAFDLIGVSASADLAGTDALSETYELTVEAFAQYLDHLTPRGLLALDGPTRLPPRLALRLVATARAALAARGVAEAGRHVAMLRGWQQFALLVSATPIDPERAAALREFARTRAFDLVWLPDLEPDEPNRYQRLAEPRFHAGAAALLGPAAGAFAYAFDVTPATDDRPYARLFTRARDLGEALGAAEGVGGSRLDAGFVMAAATLVQALAAGALFILLPLVGRRRTGRAGGHGWAWRTPLYFGLIGLAFLFVEIAWIQRLQLFLGHPIYATAVALEAFLVFAGLGSLACQRLAEAAAPARLRLAVVAIVVIGLSYVFGLPTLLYRLADLPDWTRVLVSIALLAPLAFAMGMPFPLALRALGSEAPGLVPWAWAVNGCASVVSAVAAPLLAAAVGFSGLLLMGLTCYLVLPAVFSRSAAGDRA